MDPIATKISDNNREIELARKICDIIQTDGFKLFLDWMMEHHKEWESLPIHSVKDVDHLNFLKGGIQFSYEINAQLQHWEKKAKEEEKKVPK